MKVRVAALGLAMLTLPGLRGQSFQSLGAGLGGSQSMAWSVSADGSSVVGTIDFGSGAHAFRWRAATGMQDLGGLLGANFTDGFGASADGSVVAGTSWSSSFGNTRGVVWSPGGMSALAPLPQAVESHAYAVSGNGQFSVGYSYSGLYGNRATRWANGVPQDLGIGPAGGSIARAVSTDGSVIVGLSNSAAGAFRWRDGVGMEELATPAGLETVAANGVSGDGNVVAGRASIFSGPDATVHAVRWVGSSVEDIGLLTGANYTEVLAVNGDGSVLVGRATLPMLDHRAVIWTQDDGFVDLNQMLTSMGVDLTGFKLKDAWGVSADGRTIVGQAAHEYLPGVFRDEAYVATVPEPGAMVTFLLGVSALRRKWRR